MLDGNPTWDPMFDIPSALQPIYLRDLNWKLDLEAFRLQQEALSGHSGSLGFHKGMFVSFEFCADNPGYAVFGNPISSVVLKLFRRGREKQGEIEETPVPTGDLQDEMPNWTVENLGLVLRIKTKQFRLKPIQLLGTWRTAEYFWEVFLVPQGGNMISGDISQYSILRTPPVPIGSDRTHARKRKRENEHTHSTSEISLTTSGMGDSSPDAIQREDLQRELYRIWTALQKATHDGTALIEQIEALWKKLDTQGSILPSNILTWPLGIYEADREKGDTFLHLLASNPIVADDAVRHIIRHLAIEHPCEFADAVCTRNHGTFIPYIGGIAQIQKKVLYSQTPLHNAVRWCLQYVWEPMLQSLPPQMARTAVMSLSGSTSNVLHIAAYWNNLAFLRFFFDNFGDLGVLETDVKKMLETKNTIAGGQHVTPRQAAQHRGHASVDVLFKNAEERYCISDAEVDLGAYLNSLLE